MPFYEFSCPSCELLLEYHSKRATSETPRCPHCGGPLEREVHVISTGPRGVDADSGDGLGGGFADPERAAAAGEGLDGRIAAARRSGGEAAAAAEIAATADAAGLSLDPDWRDAAAKAAAGDESAYDALVDAGIEPLARTGGPAAARPADPKPRFRRDPELRELEPPPLPRRKPSPWDA